MSRSRQQVHAQLRCSWESNRPEPIAAAAFRPGVPVCAASPRCARLHVTKEVQMPTAARSTSRHKVRAHRTRLRKAGLRPVQIWVLDVRRSPSLGPRTVSRWRWPRVLMPSRTRSSSTRFRPGMRNETWRDLDRCRWRSLRGQTATRGYRPRQPIRRDRLDRRVPLDHRSDAGTDFPAVHQAKRPEWAACAMPDDGGQVDCGAEETPRKAGRITRLRRSEDAQPRHLRIPGLVRNGRVVRLASRRRSPLPLSPASSCSSRSITSSPCTLSVGELGVS